MYDDLRTVSLTGGLTKDGEYRVTNSGTAVLKLNLGCSESRKVNDQYEKKSHYFEVTVWGRYAEVLQQKMVKGTKLAITGKLDFQQWDQDGQKRSKVNIKADQVEILSNQSNNNQSYQQSQNKQGYQSNDGGNFEDDIPFFRSEYENMFC